MEQGGLMNEMKLPVNEYEKIEKDGQTITVCTMRQKALHTIGLNSGHVGRRLYTRHGKKYYRPFRNYFCGRDRDLDLLADAGYMDFREYNEKDRTYWFNRAGLDWLGTEIGVYIYDEDC